MRNRICSCLTMMTAAAMLLPGAALAEPARGLKPGDRMPAFPVTAVTGPYAGKTVAYGSVLQGAPTLVVFVSDLGDKNTAVLAKAEEALRRFAGAGLKGFGVCLAGQSVAADLGALAKKHNWTMPMTVTRGGANDPVCKLCRLNPKAKNTVIVSAKNQVVYLQENLAPDAFKAVVSAVEKLVKK